MKFLQVHTYYGPYLQGFASHHPELELCSHQAAMKSLLADGFGACHLLASHLDPREFDSRLLIPNFIEGQDAWCREFGFNPHERPDDLLRRQIAEVDPDVLYLSDPVTYDSAFVRSLSKRPALVLGWRAAPVLPTTDWSEFDVMVSNHEPTLQVAIQRGAKAIERFRPGFPHFLADAVKGEPEDSDVTFCGQWSTDHAVRNQWWLNLAKATLTQPRDFQLDYYLMAHAPRSLPAAVAMFNRGPRFGLEMHRALRRSRICLNAMIDMGQGQSANMRLFEIAGTGAFQLMEHHDDIGSIFEPGAEIETYRSHEELLEKIFYYLDHPAERRAIAKRGQERCLRDYSIERRARDFEGIIRRHLEVSRQSAGVMPVAQKPKPGHPTLRKRISASWKRSWNSVRKALFPRSPNRTAAPEKSHNPQAAPPEQSKRHSTEAHLAPLPLEQRPRYGYCPGCGSQDVKHLTRRPYSQTFMKWGVPDFHQSDIMPRFGDPLIPVSECRACGLNFVPERPQGLVDSLEANPKFFSLVIKGYQAESQPIVTEEWLDILMSSQTSLLTPFDRHHRYLLEFVIARKKPGGSFLDLGCNMGGFAAMVALSDKTCHVAGCEINSHCWDEFSRRYPALTLYRDPIGSAPVDRKFDLIFCSDVIEHIWDLDAFLRDIVAILADNGRLIFTTPNLKCDAAQAQGWDWWGFILPHHCQLFDARSLPALLSRFHLTTLEVASHGDEMILVCDKLPAQP